MGFPPESYTTNLEYPTEPTSLPNRSENLAHAVCFQSERRFHMQSRGDIIGEDGPFTLV